MNIQNWQERFAIITLVSVCALLGAGFKLMMKSCMRPCGREKYKVVKFIIKTIPINVVNNFFRKEVAFKMFFHYKTMFKDIACFSAKRMVGLINKHISIAFALTTLPRRIASTFIIFWSNFIVVNATTMVRAIFSFSTFVVKKFSFAKLANVPFHTVIIAMLLGLSSISCATKAKVFKYEDGVKNQVIEMELSSQAGMHYKEHADGTIECDLDSRKPTMWERFISPVVSGASENINTEVK